MVSKKGRTKVERKHSEAEMILQQSSAYGRIAQITKGVPYPFGVNEQGGRFNFAVYAGDASSCSLRLFLPGGKDSFADIMMYRDMEYESVFTLSADIDFGYSTEITGLSYYEYLYETDKAVFADKYAKRISGREMFGEKAEYIRGCVELDNYSWHNDHHVRYDYSDMVIYKLNVRSFTMHESSGAKNKGTYAGITEKLRSIKALGINTVLLMPCADFEEVMDTGRINCWGFGVDTFHFAPKASFAANPQNCCTEFRDMVKKLHSAEIEVMLEMDLSDEPDKAMIIECLRFWVRKYHIDGFRLYMDYETAHTVANDAYLKNTQLIYERWDTNRLSLDKAGLEKRLAVCNDDFMNDMRQFLKGDNGFVQIAANRIRDNSDTLARVNYVADHNGYTLSDIYSYDAKHNEENGEKNKDGREVNYSWNCGAEGDTSVNSILRLRQCMIKNALLVLFFSQGTPMLMAGDELANSHYGNNNTYCCDNIMGWLKWNNKGFGRVLKKYTAELINTRFKYGIIHRREALTCMDFLRLGNPDISFHGTKAWFPDYSYSSHMLGIMLNGQYSDGKSVYLACNMHWEQHEFDLPDAPSGEWELLTATSKKAIGEVTKRCYRLPARSTAVFISK